MASPLAIAGGVLSGASLISSLLRKPGSIEVPNLNAEIARIRALYDQARKVATANIKGEAAAGRTQAASNLATRGIYSSPVSEGVFGKLRDAETRDLATAEATIGAQEADATSRIIGALLNANQSAQAYNLGQKQQREQDIYGGLGSLGSTLLMAGLSPKAAPGAPGQIPGAGVSSVPGQFTPTPAGFTQPLNYTPVPASPSYFRPDSNNMAQLIARLYGGR